MTNVSRVIADKWKYSHGTAHENAARIVVQAAWPATQRLTFAARRRTKLSLIDVQNLVYPETAGAIASDAYRLAARSVAGRHSGTSAVYLSVFNYQGQGSEFREIGEPNGPLASKELALLAIAGQLASLKATDLMTFDTNDKYARAVCQIDERTVYGRGTGMNGFIRTYTPDVERFNARHWATIEQLATSLMRQYSLIGDEISDVLTGTAMDLVDSR